MLRNNHTLECFSMSTRQKKNLLRTIPLVVTIVLVFAALVLRLLLFAGRFTSRH